MSKSMGMVATLSFAMLAMLFSGPAFAQLDAAGAAGWGVFCDFIKSPLVTLVVAATVVGLIIAMMSNEENKLVGSVLKILIGIGIILTLPGLLTMIGLSVPGPC